MSLSYSFGRLLLSSALGIALVMMVAGAVTPAYASDNQNPNVQIKSTNTQLESGNPFVRYSVYTDDLFGSNGSAYTYQMNTVVNGCTSFPTPCNITYWIQGVVGVDKGSLIGQPAGWYVHDAHIELVYGPANGDCGAEGNCVSICEPSIPQLVNINNTDYNVLEQVNIDPTFPPELLKLTLAVSDQSTGQVFYSVSATCAPPSGAGLVQFFTQTEGVIVGCGAPACGTNEKFTPHGENLFDNYIDMTSEANKMSSTLAQTQTAEGSNLYQDVYDCFGESYQESYYLYTVMSYENTYSGSGAC